MSVNIIEIFNDIMTERQFNEIENCSQLRILILFQIFLPLRSRYSYSILDIYCLCFQNPFYLGVFYIYTFAFSHTLKVKLSMHLFYNIFLFLSLFPAEQSFMLLWKLRDRLCVITE